MRLFKESHFTAFNAAGKGAFHIAKKLAFQQIFRKSGTVDGDERTILTRTGIVDALRKQFLSSSGFSYNDDIGIRGGISARRVNGGVDDSTLMNNVVKGIFCPESFFTETSADLIFQLLYFSYIR